MMVLAMRNLTLSALYGLRVSGGLVGWGRGVNVVVIVVVVGCRRQGGVHHSISMGLEVRDTWWVRRVGRKANLD